MRGAVFSLRTKAHKMVFSSSLAFPCSPFFLYICANFYTFVVNGLQPYVESIFQLLNIIAQDTNRSEGLLRASMGVIGLVLLILYYI